MRSVLGGAVNIPPHEPQNCEYEWLVARQLEQIRVAVDGVAG